MNNIQIYEEYVKHLIYDVSFMGKKPPIFWGRRFSIMTNNSDFGIPQTFTFKRTILMIQKHLKTVLLIFRY